LVIFIAGLITGGVAVKKLTFRPPPRPPLPAREMNAPMPAWVRDEFVRRMVVELNLTSQQTERIMKTVHESQERIRELYSLIGPEMREELDYVRESIRAELTPEQAGRFDEIRERQRRFAEMGRPGNLRQRLQQNQPYPYNGLPSPPANDAPQRQPAPRKP
jgi:hypothetical protein